MWRFGSERKLGNDGCPRTATALFYDILRLGVALMCNMRNGVSDSKR